MSMGKRRGGGDGHKESGRMFPRLVKWKEVPLLLLKKQFIVDACDSTFSLHFFAALLSPDPIDTERKEKEKEHYKYLPIEMNENF